MQGVEGVEIQSERYGDNNLLHQTNMRPKSLLPLRKPRPCLRPNLILALDTPRPSNSRNVPRTIKVALDVASPEVDILRVDPLKPHRDLGCFWERDVVKPFLGLVAVDAWVDAGGQRQVWGEGWRAWGLVREVGWEGLLDEINDDLVQGLSGWWRQPEGGAWHFEMVLREFAG